MARPPMPRGGAPMFEGNALPDAPTAIPEFQVSTRSGAALGSLADQIAQLGGQADRTANAAALEEAHEAGTASGDRDPAARATDGGLMVRTAFNRAAADSASRRLELNSRQQLTELEQQHATDPAAFATAAAAWRDGVAESLPPDVRARFGQAYDALAQPAQQRVVTAQRRQVADQALADFNALAEPRLAAAARAAGDPATAAAADREEQTFLTDLSRNGPRDAFTLGGRQFPADPTRTEGLSLVQMQSQWQAFRREVREHRVLGQWRAAGRSPDWIDRWEQAALSPNAGAAGTGSLGLSRLLDTIERTESSGNARATSETSSASGAFQFTRDTWLAVVARNGGQRIAGLSREQILQLRFDRAFAREMAAAHVQQDLIPALTARGVEPSALAIYAGYHFGDATAARIMTAPADRPMSEVVGPSAMAANGYLEGMTAGAWRERYGRRFPPSAGLGVAVPADMPPDEARRIAEIMRGELVRERATLQAEQTRARADLDPLIQQNRVAIGVNGQPLHRITDDQYAAAGYNPATARRDEDFLRHRYTAGQEVAMATTPEAATAIAARFAPGTALFAADPRAAAQVIEAAVARGAQVQGATLARRIADLRAEAAATGNAGTITEDEGRAAGLRPEQVAAENRLIAQAGERRRAAEAATRMPPSERPAALARLPITGENAEENAGLVRAYAQAWREADTALRADPAGYVLQHNTAARGLADQVMQGDLRVLPGLIDVLRRDQERWGVAPDDRRAVPAAVAQSIATRLAMRPTDTERLMDLAGVMALVQDAPARTELTQALVQAGVPEHLAVAARISPRVGAAAAARVAGELGTDLRGLNLPESLRRDVRDTVGGVWDSDDRLGGLRRRQAERTGDPWFIRDRAEAERRLSHIVSVRSAPGGSAASSEVRNAYAQLFGGIQVVDEAGVLAVVPAGTDASRLQRGLEVLRDRALQTAFPGGSAAAAQTRGAAGRGIWADAGSDGRLAYYPPGSPMPMPGPDGQPITVSVTDALAAGELPGRDGILPRAQRRERFRQPDTRPEGGRPTGQVEPGNIDLTNRPSVANADGSISTVRTISIGTERGEVVIPTVSDDGRVMTDDEAVQHFEQSGRHFGIFRTPQQATDFARRLSADQAELLRQRGEVPPR